MKDKQIESLPMFRVRASAAVRGRVLNQYHEVESLKEAQSFVKDVRARGSKAKASMMDIEKRFEGRIWRMNWSLIERWVRRRNYKWERTAAFEIPTL